MTAKSLLFIEFNELNFEFVEHYVRQGHLPAFADFLGRHGYSETRSETRYEELEPWIQWVTAHTGQPLKEHGVFRLGDIVDHDIPQIWERLEDKGLSVGAISPMNAKYRLRDPAFFVPDPWTPTDLSAPPVVKRLYNAISAAVNDNASSRITFRSLLDIAAGGLATARIANYPRYLSYVLQARSKPWTRALFLDLLLADLFGKFVAKTRPHFASLFLNAAAHIQHHYMFSSSAYSGPLKNPDWYVPQGVDPLLEVYQLYDHVLATLQRDFPLSRIMVATGLHQDPHPEVTYYWRLTDHADFLRRIGIEFSKIEPRMSRDFIVRFDDAQSASVAARRLEAANAFDGQAIFEVDNRGSDLFVMFIYPNDISPELGIRIGNEDFPSLRSHVSFVAIKNGRHNGTGYFADNGSQASAPFELADIPSRIEDALAV